MSEQPVDLAQARSEMRTAADRRVAIAAPAPKFRFDLAEMDVRWEGETGTLWSFMTPTMRPSFNPAMLRDLQAWQQEIRRAFSSDDSELRYLVLGSRYPGASTSAATSSLSQIARKRGIPARLSPMATPASISSTRTWSASICRL